MQPTPSRITQPAMAEHIRAGDAAPLLHDGVPGPVHHRGRWWAVPADAEHYEPVPEATGQELTARARRLGKLLEAAGRDQTSRTEAPR
jgi:hypothetical protein